MKKIKSLVAVSLALCMVLCFAGCSSNHDEGNLKDNLVNGFNNWLESFSKHAVTKDKNLQGERENDIDQYTGSYTASYDGFNGEEFIFGGTALERDNGSNLEATYSLTITSGEATLYWLSSGEEHIICEESADDTYKFTLREMFGEGQVWYNMKRLNKDIISNLDSKIIPEIGRAHV